MSTTITCNDTDCGYTTDIELISETNPKRCPECGDILMIDGIDKPLYVNGEYNDILFEDE